MKSGSFHIWESATAMILALCSATIAAGDQMTLQENRNGLVAVGGVSILTIRFPAAGMSVKRRAGAVTDRLRYILADPTLKPSDIVAVPEGDNAAKIMVKGRLLVEVEPETARYNTTTPLALAQEWTQHLRQVLPEVNVRPNPNLGEPTGGGKQH
jgi:hypothetical protein